MKIKSSQILAIILILLLLWSILTQIRENLTQNDPKLLEIVRNLEKMDPRIGELDIFVGDNRSYTINKEKIYLCMKDRQGKYYENNALTYVLLHEIAHTLCTSVGHTDEFYGILDDLVAKAQKKGLYDPSIPMPDNYCNY